MPYAGIPPEKTKDMESCVKQVMAQGHDKSSAIAICHKSIMGTKKVTKSKSEKENVITKGGEDCVSKKDEKIEELIEKNDDVTTPAPEAKVEEPKVEEAVVAEPKAEEPKVEEPKVEEPKVEAPAEPKTEEAPAEEAKAEVVAEEADKVEKKQKVEPKAEVPAEEPKVEETPVVVEPKAEEPKVEVPVENKEVADKAVDIFKAVADTLVKINEKLDAVLAKAAPVGGVPEAEEAPKAVEEPKVEEPVTAPEETPAPAEEPKVEVKEEVKKTDTPARGTEEILKEFNSIKERLESLEKSPAPLKAVTFARVFGVETPANDELTKIETRLDEITKVRESNPESYSRDTKLIDEAFTLIKRKRELKG